MKTHVDSQQKHRKKKQVRMPGQACLLDDEKRTAEDAYKEFKEMSESRGALFH